MISRSFIRASDKHVVVVGGGIAGITTAFNVLEQVVNSKVTLVEKAPKVAQGASSKNGFLLCPSLDYPWTSNSIVDLNDLSNGILPNVLFAPRKSPVRFQPSSLTNASVLDFGLNWVGRAQNAKPIGALMEYSMSLYKGEEKFVNLDFNQGLAKGTQTIDGKVDERDSSGDIKKFCVGLKKLMVEEHGKGGTGRLTIETNKRIKRAVTRGSEVAKLKVRDERFGTESSIFGDAFVVAAGTGSRGIVSEIGVSCPTVPVKGYLLTFSSSTEVTCNMALPNKMFVAPMSGDGGRFMYRCSGLAVFGGKDAGVDWEGKERVVEEEDRAALDQMSGVICEQFEDVKVLNEDYGFRCLAPDDVPLIGRTKYDNLYLNTGHGSKGWTMGAGAGKLCSQLVLGLETEIDSRWYDPLRFQREYGECWSGLRMGLGGRTEMKAQNLQDV